MAPIAHVLRHVQPLHGQLGGLSIPVCPAHVFVPGATDHNLRQTMPYEPNDQRDTQHYI